MFQLVKSIADFPSIIYLLAFDKTVVAKALNKVQDGDGGAYLEKIVNIPIELPRVSSAQMRRLIADEINDFASKHPSYDWEAKPRLGLVFEALHPIFETVRTVTRFANILQFSEAAIAADVDLVDLIALSAIQAANEQLYYFIRDNSPVLLDTSTRRLVGDRSKAIDKTTVEQGLQTAATGHRAGTRQLLELITLLFPNTKLLFENTRRSDEEAREWLRDRRICASQDVFEAFFQLTIAEDVLSRSRMRAILDDLTANGFQTAFSELIRDGKALAFLNELKVYIDEENVIAAAPTIVKVLFDKGDLLAEGDTSSAPVRSDGETLIMQIVYQLLRRLPSQRDRFEILISSIRSARESIYCGLQLVGLEDQIHGRYNLGGSGETSNALVSDDELNDLENAGRTAIEAWASDGRLDAHRHLPYLLYRWADWGGKEKLTRYVSEQLNECSFGHLIAVLARNAALKNLADVPTLENSGLDVLLPLSDIRDRIGDVLRSKTVAVTPEDQDTLRILIADRGDLKVESSD